MGKIVRELAPRHNYVKQSTNIIGPPAKILDPSHFDHAMLDFITN